MQFFELKTVVKSDLRLSLFLAIEFYKIEISSFFKNTLSLAHPKLDIIKNLVCIIFELLILLLKYFTYFKLTIKLNGFGKGIFL